MSSTFAGQTRLCLLFVLLYNGVDMQQAVAVPRRQETPIGTEGDEVMSGQDTPRRLPRPSVRISRSWWTLAALMMGYAGESSWACVAGMSSSKSRVVNKIERSMSNLVLVNHIAPDPAVLNPFATLDLRLHRVCNKNDPVHAMTSSAGVTPFPGEVYSDGGVSNMALIAFMM